MFAELVKELLYSWQNADAEQVEAWANGEAWAELQALAQCQAAQQSARADKCPECGTADGYHKTGCSLWLWEPSPRTRLTQTVRRAYHTKGETCQVNNGA